jgi:hypothetical protein
MILAPSISLGVLGRRSKCKKDFRQTQTLTAFFIGLKEGGKYGK